MIVLKFDTQEEWLAGRLGKVTGSRLGDFIPKKTGGLKMGYYELIAEKMALPPDTENVMDRGHRLEEEALELFEKETGKKVDKSLVIWTREDNQDIAISPDGFIGKTEACEVKCLASPKHIQALLEQEIPADYKYQVLQYFIVNDKLKKLYFIFYDPRLITKQLFYLEVKREEVQEDVEKYLEYQKKTIQEINEIVNKWTF